MFFCALVSPSENGSVSASPSHPGPWPHSRRKAPSALGPRDQGGIGLDRSIASPWTTRNRVLPRVHRVEAPQSLGQHTPCQPVWRLGLGMIYGG